jgi:glycosyltransferase involved in cell wall biosynthesis
VIVGIDAANIRGGGGVTHLIELLKAADPAAHGFSRVVVWGGAATLAKLENRPWLEKVHEPTLDRGLIHRARWQARRLSNLARRARCDVLFVPGGSFAGDFSPVVAFHQNLLPFEWRELKRFGWSRLTTKWLALRISQSRTFRRADGVIFLTRYARDAVMRVIGRPRGKTCIIPHGIDGRFVRKPRDQHPIDAYSDQRPFRLLYVSIVDMYKHQWHVAAAVALLRERGWPLTLEMVGPAYPPALDRLTTTMKRLDPSGSFLHYVGPVSYEHLDETYERADLFVFASSCETFGQIVTEAMSAGLPIACSSRAAMPELLGPDGAYFDPENPESIAQTLSDLISSPDARRRQAESAFETARAYSWERCAAKTFAFLSSIASIARCTTHVCSTRGGIQRPTFASPWSRGVFGSRSPISSSRGARVRDWSGTTCFASARRRCGERFDRDSPRINGIARLPASASGSCSRHR